MTMKILIVEDAPVLSRLYIEMFRRIMPEARVDTVVSVGGYLKVSDTRYDAYIMDEKIDEEKSAFEHIAPHLQAKFPDALVLHNGSDSDPEYISQQERIHRIRFARGPDGRVITCKKNIAIAIEVIRAMVMPKDEAKAKAAFPERIPICQSTRANPENKIYLRCCRP